MKNESKKKQTNSSEQPSVPVQSKEKTNISTDNVEQEEQKSSQTKIETHFDQKGGMNIEDISIKDILEEKVPEILELKEEISNYKAIETLVKKEIQAKKKLLKPIPRDEKKLKGKKAAKLSRENREVIPVEIKYLEERFLWIKEHIKLAFDKLTIISNGEKEKLSLQSLRDKSNSKNYTSRNIYFIKNKLLESINEILRGTDLGQKEMLNRVRQLAFKPGEEGQKEFNERLGELLKDVDEKTYILCSGKLKNKLYEAVRFTLQQYNPKETEIKKLIFQEDMEEDDIEEKDPLERNKGLAQSILLNFLNQMLDKDETKEKLDHLASFSKNEKTQEFYSELNEFIYDEDTELYIMCSGVLKTRLYNALRLTLKNWDPAEGLKFNEIIFTEMEA